MGFALLAVLCVLLLGGLPRWRYRGTLAYIPSGIVGTKTVDKTTDQQIAARVRQHLAE